MKVKFKRVDGWEIPMFELKLVVPEKFVELCQNYYNCKPEEMMRLLVFFFTKHPPSHLEIYEPDYHPFQRTKEGE